MNHQRTPPKRGLVVVSLISCLIEWLSPRIGSETVK